MKLKSILFILSFVLLEQVCIRQKTDVYMFSCFMGNREDGLHLAYSTDGLDWKVLNDNKSFLTPEVGEDKHTRDSCVIQEPDGKFHLVWTVSWKEKGIAYAHSEDLKNWGDISGKVKFPKGTKHGTVFTVNA